MKKFFTLFFILFVAILFIHQKTFAQNNINKPENIEATETLYWTEGFETGTWQRTSGTTATSNATGGTSESNGVWILMAAGTSTPSPCTGAHALRFPGSSSGYAITPTLSSGVGTITFGSKRTTKVMSIFISTDNGSTWPTSSALSSSGTACTTNSIHFTVSGSTCKVKFFTNTDFDFDDLKIYSYQSTPVLTVSVKYFTSFGSIATGNNSASKNFTVSGTNLTTDITVTAPTYFKVSRDNSTFQDTVMLRQSGGSVGTTTVYARFQPTTTDGTHTGNITIASTGATTANVAVWGCALAAEPTTVSTVTFGTVTSNSIVVNFSGGNGGHRIVVGRASSDVSWTPTDSIAASGVDSAWGSATDQGSGNKIVYDNTGSTVTVTGLNSSTTYYFKVYEYNVGTNTSQNYLTTSYGSGNQATLAGPLITVSTTYLTSFGSVATGDNSASKNFTVSGSNLTDDITVTAPTYFKVSRDNSTFQDTVMLRQSGGTVGTTTVYARFQPTTTDGTHNGNIACTSSGATTANVAVWGCALALEPTTATTVSFGTVTSNSIVVNFTGGDGGHRIVVGRASNDVSWSPTDSIAASGVNSAWGSATDQGSGNKIVYDNTGSSVTVTGLTASTTYYFRVYEYNVGTNTSQNYLTSSYGSGNQATSYATSNTDCFKSTNGGGAWSSTSTWQSSANNVDWYSSSLVPDSMATNIEILNGHTVTITTTQVKIGNTTVDNGGTLAVGSSSTAAVSYLLSLGSGKTLTVNGTLANADTVQSAFVIGGTITVGSTGVYNLTAAPIIAATQIPTATWSTGSTCEITGIVGYSTSSRPFGADYTGLYGANQTFSNFTVDCPNLAGKLVLTRNCSSSAGYFSFSNTFTVNNTGSAAYLQLTSSGNQESITSSGGSFVQNGGVAGIVHNTSNITAKSFNIGGSFTLNGGTFDVSGYTLGTTETSTLKVAGNVTIANGATLQKNITVPGGSGDYGIAQLELFGNGTITNNGNLSNKINIIIDGSVSEQLGSDLNPAGTITLTGSLAIGAHTLTLQNALLGTPGNLSGDATSSIVIAGSASGINIPSNITELSNLTINNSNGTTLQANLQVDGLLTFTSGVITTSGHTFSLGPSATIPDSVTSNNVNGVVNFPSVPVNYGSYNKLGISIASGSDDIGNVTIKLGTGDNGGKTTYSGHSSINKKWTISIDGDQPASGRDVTFTWTTTDDGISQGQWKTGIEAHVYYSTDNGTSWIAAGDPTSLSNTEKTHSITVTGVTHFSDWTITDENNPFPVQMTTFTADAKGDAVTLKWNTASEVNNTGWEVQRAFVAVKDSGKAPSNYEKLGFVKGNINSNSPKDYSYLDKSVKQNGKYYYKLKQIDNDGTYKYSQDAIVKIDIPLTYAISQNYPNPFNPSTTINYQIPVAGKVMIKIYNILGDEVTTLVNEEKDAGRYSVVFNASRYASGIYFYRVQSGSFVMTKKMVLMK